MERRRPEAPAPARRNPLHLWHLLSLDAPTVAVVWLCFVARASGLRLPWISPAAMFVAVWMLYAADRLLDGRALVSDHREAPVSSSRISISELEERHFFHHRHRHVFLAGIVLAAIVLAALVHNLDPRETHLYAILGVLLAGWLLMIHAQPAPADAHRLPKELAVGVFFPAAVFIPTVARAPQLRSPLLGPALLFAAVCGLNCVFLYAWEHPRSRASAHATTRWAVRHLRQVAPAIASVSAVVACCYFKPLKSAPHTARPDFLIASACAFSASLLLLLQAWRRHFSALTLRAAADLALLTPGLWLLWVHVLPR